MRPHPSVKVVCPTCLSGRNLVCVERVQEKIVWMPNEPHPARVQAWIDGGRPFSTPSELMKVGTMSDQRRIF